MASTTFVNYQTVIDAGWLNDVNSAVYSGTFQATTLSPTNITVSGAITANGTISGSGFSTYLASPPAIGGTTAAAGSFTTLSGSTSVTSPIVGAASGASLSLRANGTTYATILGAGTNNGYFGIGTASPSAPLEISTGGGTKFRVTSTIDNNADIDFYTNGVYRGIIEGNSVGMLFGTIGALPNIFITNNTERARIDSSGNLLLNSTSNFATSSRQFIKFDEQAQIGITLQSTNATTGGSYQYFVNSAGNLAGSISHSASTAVLYNVTSDYRLKNVIGSVTGQGERLDALKPVDYTWKDGGQQARGFLAHEFQEIYGNSVTGQKDAVDDNGNPIYQAMQASTPEVIADLVAEIQSLRARLKAANIA